MPVTSELAIRAIIGEAANQGQIGMQAVAEAIRNRATLQGVMGVHNPRVEKEPEWVWKKAEAAWKHSALSNITNGANGWGNSKDIKKFIEEGWWHQVEVKAVIGDHVFYYDPYYDQFEAEMTPNTKAVA